MEDVANIIESEEESMGEPAKTLRLIGMLLLAAFISLHSYRLFFQQTIFEQNIDVTSIKELSVAHKIATLPQPSNLELEYYVPSQNGANRRLYTRWGAAQAEIVVCDNEQQALREYLFYRADATQYAKGKERKLSQDITVTAYDRYYVSLIQQQRDHMTGLPVDRYFSSLGFIKQNLFVRFDTFSSDLSVNDQQELIGKVVDFLKESCN